MTLIIKTTGLEDYLEGGSGRVKFLVAGGPGAGKTRFASFAPRPIYAACEDGLMSVADRKVPYGRIESEADMDAFLSLLELEARKPEPQRRFETVVVDTLDAYERTVIHHYLKKRKQAEMDGWEDWGYLATRMNDVITRLVALPFNLIILLHTKDQKVGKPPVDRTILRLKGDLKEQLPADFDFVGLMENEFGPVDGQAGQVIRTIRWTPTPLVDWCKARGGALTVTPVEFKDSDFGIIRDKIRAQLEALEAATVVETLETRPEPEVPAPAPGGPVSAGPRVAAVKPAARPAAPPAARPAPVTPAAKPPAAAPAPVPTSPLFPTSPEQAIENVEKVLGGKVIEDTDAPAEPEKAAEESNSAAETPVGTPDVAEEPSAAGEPIAEPVAEVVVPTPGSVPNDAESFTVQCGSPRYTNGTPAREGVGCGKALTVTLTAGRVTGVAPSTDESGNPVPQVPDLVEIAGIREKAFLHNACFAAAKQMTSTN